MSCSWGTFLLLILYVVPLNAWFWNGPFFTDASDLSKDGSSSPRLSLEDTVPDARSELLRSVARRIQRSVDDSGQERNNVPVRTPNNHDYSETGENIISLQQLIGSLTSEDITQVSGPSGRLAFLFKQDTNVGLMAHNLLPGSVHPAFSLIFHLKSTTDDAAVLFSITDPSQSVMYLGVKMSAVENSERKIILYYADTALVKTEEVANFTIPHQPEKWSQFALAVESNQVSFYEDCESEPKVEKLKHLLDKLVLAADCKVFVGHSGDADHDRFQGLISKLSWIGNTQAAEHHCDEADDDDYDGSGDTGSGAEDKKEIEGNNIIIANRDPPHLPVSSDSKNVDCCGPPRPPGAPGVGCHASPGHPGPPGPPGNPGPPGEKGHCCELGLPDTAKNEQDSPSSFTLFSKWFLPWENKESLPRQESQAVLPGPMGPQGPPGPPGPPGPAFQLSADGNLNELALQYVPGVMGPPGPQGPQGIPGLPGKAGFPGFSGMKGDEGLRGRDGIPGLDGFPGRIGLKGNRGWKGDKGDPGSVVEHSGPPGPPGPQGPPGQMACNNSYGQMGLKGDRGKPGQPGHSVKGQKGEPGPGFNYSPSLINKEERTVPVGAAVQRGPKGELGLPGRPGRPGLNGKKGEKGECCGGGSDHRDYHYSSSKFNYAIKGDKGERGAPGIPGLPGLTANFDIFALKHELKGEHGSKGEKGDPGDGMHYGRVQGPPGRPGPPGQKGDANIGPPGPPGPPGTPGINCDGCTDDSRSPDQTRPTGDLFPHRQSFSASGPPGPPGPPGPSSRVMLLRSFEALAASPLYLPEGTLLYVKDSSKLYMIVQEGIRRVMLGDFNYFPRGLNTHVGAADPAFYYPQDNPTPYPPQPDVWHPHQARNPDPPHRPVRPSGREHSQSHATVHQHATGHWLRLIALNSPQRGDMHGIRGADHQCFSQAQAIGLKGTYRAFLSSQLQDLYSIVRKNDRDLLPIVNLKGEELFGDWEAIFSDSEGSINNNAHILSFDGRDVLRNDNWPDKMLWHGSSPHGQRDIQSFCESWRSDGVGITGMASSLQDGRLLQQSPHNCAKSFIVLCIENSYSAH